ncbi:hypothetical protein MPSEU_000741900 [Mayamaea pseudoterrestris]|nr:hypothetical protein MPSEU_000741900 [Mayamaea pseudoterrestris]
MNESERNIVDDAGSFRINGETDAEMDEPYEDAFDYEEDTPRLVRRNLPFNQSRNIIQVKHNQGTTKIGRLLRHDFFHVLLRLPAWKTTLMLLCIWTSIILVWAAAYMAVDRSEQSAACGIGLRGTQASYYTAFAFSLETCTTLGYGLPNSVNAFFEYCPAFQFTVYLQMTMSMFFNAFLIAIIIARIANAANRSAQVVFSNKAIVSIDGNQVRFMFRVFDVDSRHPVVEAHVRLYGVTKDRPVPRPLRTIQPNDDLGGMLFLSLPQVVSHHIDIYSLLHPSRDDNGHAANPVNTHNNQGLVLRQADSGSCNREEVVCFICGDDYGTHERWIKHVNFQQRLERKNGYPIEGTHLSIQPHELSMDSFIPEQDLKVLQNHFMDNISEVICLVEGIDPLTSGSFTALYSYRAADVIWDNGAAFRPCLRVENDMFRVDLDRFHDIVRKRSERKQQVSMRVHDGLFSEQVEPKAKEMHIPQPIAEDDEEAFVPSSHMETMESQ